MSDSRAKRFHLKRGDTVLILNGDEKGKTAKVLKVNRKNQSAVMERINFVKRHVRPGHPTAPQGGVIEKEAPIEISNLMLVCPKCNKPMRVKNQRMGKGKRVRICANCEEQID